MLCLPAGRRSGCKYTQLMMKEIEDLNEEDRARDASGGNVQVQYNARGLI